MFQQKPEDRLRSWRNFRSTLDILPLESALARTAEYWARAPFAPYHLDPESVDTWPNPWELVDENIYCDIAKCLGIVYTMLLTKHRMDLDIEVRVYKNPKNLHEYNLAWFNQGKYILNMIDGAIVNIKQVEETLRLKKTITAVELKLEQY